MIPYQMITDFDNLKIAPENGFFEREDFYSRLKEKEINFEEYENVKFFFTVLRLKTLGDLNRDSNRELPFFKNFLNLMPESAIVPAPFLVVFKDLKVNLYCFTNRCRNY